MKGVKLCDILDLLDVNRESEEVVDIMGHVGRMTKVQLSALVCSDLWAPFENRFVNAIETKGDRLRVWLEEKEATE